LGPLETVLRGVGGFSDDPEFETRMIKAREARNEIAHNIFQNYDPLHSTPEQRNKILNRLKHLRFDVGIGFLNMRELRKVAEEHVGMTEEELIRMLERVESDDAAKA